MREDKSAESGMKCSQDYSGWTKNDLTLKMDPNLKLESIFIYDFNISLFCLNCPSHFEITIAHSEFPTTLTTVLAISRIRSIPAINANPSIGIQTVPRVASRTTKDTPCTPAIPFEVTIRTRTSDNCCVNER